MKLERLTIKEIALSNNDAALSLKGLQKQRVLDIKAGRSLLGRGSLRRIEFSS